MNLNRLFDQYFWRYSSIPALCYVALLVTLLVIVFSTVTDVLQRHRAVLQSAEVLARFEHRAPSSSAGTKQATGDEPDGSPFLDGPTVTVASAALLQRVTGAIVRAGGNVVSSEVKPQDAHSADGLVRITATCELEQKGLQDLLYTIEAGMPFLFVDQLLAQAPLAEGEGGRIRVVLDVSGLWPGAQSK
jgi:general secretion pathway protein M